jgi:hypothetical protein
VELDRAEHDPVIGERDPRDAVIGGPAAERIDPASAVEERVLAVNVEVDEGRGGHLLLGR